MASDTENNLHVWIPPALLAKAVGVAEREHISLDQLVIEAIESYLNRNSTKDAVIQHTVNNG